MAAQASTSSRLFDGLTYFIASSVPIGDQAGMRDILATHGAIEVCHLFATCSLHSDRVVGGENFVNYMLIAH